MADRLTEVRSRLADLKSQGKTESTSKEAGKLSQELKTLKSGGSSGSTSGGGLSNFGNILRDVSGMAQEAFAPAVGELRAGVDPLKERYSKLVADIKGEGDIARQQQTLATSRELGRRGVLPTTGLGEREIAQSIAPIQQRTQSILGQTGLQSEQQLQAIRQNIANILTGAGSQGLSTSFNLAQLGQQGAQFDQQQALQQAQQQLQQRQFEEISLPTTQANIALTQAQTGQVGAGSGGVDDITTLETILGRDLNGDGRIGTNQPPEEQDLSNAIFQSTNQGMIATLPNGVQVQLPSDWIPE